MELSDKMKQVNRRIAASGEQSLRNAVAAGGTDAAKTRQAVIDAASVGDVVAAKTWAVGMYTQVGDIVYDPEKLRKYVCNAAMQHTNATFYPGAAGVYYWFIIPEMYMGYKVYPYETQTNNLVPIKNGDIWWNYSKTALYTAKMDNANNTYPPGDGLPTVWGKVKA